MSLANNADYQDWKAIVLADGRYSPDSLIYPLWEERHTPQQAIEILTFHKCWRAPPKNRVPGKMGRPPVVLDMKQVQYRLAVAIADECLRLSGRRMDPAVLQYVLQQKAAADRIVFAEKETEAS